MSKTRIVVALSGGVDSAVAAALMVERGFEVIGVTLSLRHPDEEFSSRQNCGTLEDRRAIEETVSKLGIEHHYLDCYKDFEAKVLRPAWECYRRGVTPNPCCWCNTGIKFGELIKFAHKTGVEKLITGHYAKKVLVNGGWRLLRGDDPLKDQSYFLYRLSCEQLAFADFPLGWTSKSEVKRLAGELNLRRVAEKRESQDACFSFAGEPFPETLRRLFGEEMPGGVFTYGGKVVGGHDGIHRYTTGQRKGLNVALGVPAYIKRITAATGEIELVTDQRELECAEFRVGDLNWQISPAEVSDRELQIQIRYRSPAVAGRITAEPSGIWRVNLSSPARAVTPGQSAVFYLDDMVVGGGIIL